MSIDKNAEAKAPAPEDVTDDQKPVKETEETKADAEEAESEEGEKEQDGEVEGAKEVETDEDGKPSKSKLRREKTKARIAELEQSVARLSEQVAAADRTKPAADAAGPKPDKAKYEDHDEYIADLAAWNTEQRIIARQTKAHETVSTAARGDAVAKKAELFRERAMSLTDRYPDIEAKVFQDTSLPMSATMAETLMDSDKGPEVAYYLSANREVAQRIKSMPPLAAARELGRIEATLDIPKARTETKAPPPPSVVSGSGGSAQVRTTDSGSDKLSTDEWFRRERARVAAQRTAKAGR